MKKILQLFVAFFMLFGSISYAQNNFSGGNNVPPNTPATIPYSCNFEDANENALWQISNSTNTNQWFIGTPSNIQYPISGGCLFISNDNGANAAYTVTTAGTVVASRTIEFNGALHYKLNFDLFIGGESTLDYLKVYLVSIDTNYVGVAGTTYPYYAVAAFNLNELLTNYAGSAPYFNGYNGSVVTAGSYPREIIIPNQGPAGTVKKLVFVWKNDASAGTQPPATIDNITIVPNFCAIPSTPVISNNTQNSVDVAWTENGTASNWNIQYKLATESTWTTIPAPTNPFTLTNLNTTTSYNVRVQSDCGTEQSFWSNNAVAATLCGPITQYPWSEGFETDWTATAVAPGNAVGPNCWLNINGSNATTKWQKTTTATYIKTGLGAAQNTTGSATNACSDYLITPIVTLTGNERLRFYTKGYSTYVDHIKVAIYDIAQNGMDIASMADTTLFTTIKPNTLVSLNNWDEHIIYLNNYVGNYRIAFIRNITGGYYLNLDDITIETIPTCPKPISSSVILGETTATINWIPANQSQNSFYIYYKTPTAYSYDSVLVSGTSYTLQNLTSGTTYNYYLKAYCGSEFSAATPVKTFKTLCSIITTLPVSESFDTYGTGTSAYASCWYKLTSNPSYPSISSTNASAPGSLYFTVAYAYGYNIAVSPKIDASIPINTLKASFKMRASGLDDTLYVGVLTDPMDVTTFEQIGFVTVNAITTFEDKEFFFTNYTGSGQFLAFKAAFAATSSSIYIDNIVLDLMPSCANPTNLSISNVIDTQANLTWTENGSATLWNIEYGPTGFAHGSGTLLTGVTANPTLLTGLTAQTTYQVYVQANCGTMLSAWSSPISFTTSCAPVLTIPYSEFFDTYGTGSGTYPTCWTKVSTSTTYPYISTTYSSSPGALYIYNSASGNYSYSVLPRFDATLPLNTLMMSFKMKASGTDDTLYVGVMTDPTNISTFTQISKFLVTETTSWFDKEVFLSTYTGTGQYIAFKGSYGSTSSTIYLDNVVVNLMPTCPKPTNLTYSNVLSTSVDLGWTENGTATTWNIEYGPVGFIQGTGTMLTGIYSNPSNISNLSPQTTYQFYIQSDCNGSTSLWSNPITITTACTEISTLPWSDYFDTYGTGTSVFPICWTKNSTVSDRPYVNSTAYAGAGSLYFYSGTAGTYNIAATPIFSTSIPITSLMATFKYRTTNANDTLYVGVMTDPSNASTFETLAVLNNTTVSTWYDKVVYFNNYTGIGQYIAFKINYNSAAVYAYIDNLVINTMPSCIMPDQLTVSNATSSSLDLNWNVVGATSSWNIEYGPVGFLQGTGTLISGVTSHPYTINGLNPQTAYQFYVQSNCGTETSSWSFPTSAMTSCGIITQLPYNETFDYYGTGTTTYPTCWSKVGNLTTYPSISSTNFSAPGSLYLYCSAAGYYNYAITPQFDVTIPINTLRLEFKLRASGLDDTLYIGVMSSPTDTSTFQLISQVTVPTTGVFDDFGINLNSYTGSGQYIAFKTKYGATSSSFYIDNFHVTPIPNCARPIDLGVMNISDVSAQLYWTEDGTATTWNVEYGPTGFIPGTGTLLTGLIDTTVTINGLTAQTTYQFYAYADCGGGNISLASNPFSFTTNCTPMTTIPFIENFDTYGTGSGVIPTCWHKLSSYAATSYPYLSTTNFSAPASLYMYCGTSNYYNLVSLPAFDQTININNLRASFKMRASGLDDTLYVGVMTNYEDLNTFEVVQKVTATTTSTWEDKEIFLNSYTGTGKVIAFKTSYGATTSTIYVDNLVIDPIPTCPKPTNLTVSAILPNSVTLGFTENGSATNWAIEYGPVGFIPGTGVGTLISNVTTNPYTISGLNPQTTYQFVVKSICSLVDESVWSSPVNATTACASISTLPWSDFFDTYGTGTTIFPTCWTRNTTVTDRPYVNSTNFTSPGSLYFYSGTAGTYNIAATPIFESTIPLQTLQVQFKMRASGLDDTLYVGVMTNPQDQTTFQTIRKINVSATATWEDKLVYLNTYVGNAQYVAFRTAYGATTSTIYMDNLTIDLMPSCPTPVNPIASNTTQTSVNLSWTEVGSANTWKIEYGPAGFTPGTGSTILSTSIPFSLVSLTPSTCYDFYVQSMCSATDSSTWSVKGFFCTNQIPVNVPFNIDFETPSGFQLVNNATGNNWYIGTDTAHTVNNTAGGQNALYISNDNGLSNKYTIATSAAVVWAYRDVYFTPSTSDYTLTFDWKLYGEDNDWDYMNVYAGPQNMPTPLYLSYNIIPPVGSDTLAAYINLDSTYQTRTISLPYTQYSGQTKRIFFCWRNDSADGTQPPAAVDNISITTSSIVTCNTPTNLAVNNISNTSATITWTAGGTETEWELDYKLNSASTWTTVNVLTTPSHTLNILAPLTSYDVRVRAKCNATTFSNYTSVVNFSTTANPCLVPTNVTASNITDNAATITWTPGGSETSWQVEYKLSTSSNWTTPAAVTTPTILIQGLQNNSTYDVRVKSLCNPGESVYTTPIQFTTTGGAITFTITATSSGPGTITPNGAVSVLSGANQLFTFTPNTGCEVSTLLVDNISVPNPGLTYNFSNVTTTHTIHVTFGTIGINESEIAELVELFPNPTSTFIDIKVKNDQLLIKESKLFDMYGKLIQVFELQDNNARVDVSHISAGVYFIKMDSAKGTITKKFIKK